MAIRGRSAPSPSPQALVTVAAPLAASRRAEALALIEALGNPADPAVAARLDRLDGEAGVHFASLHALAPSRPGGRIGHLVLEVSGDGTERAVLARLTDRLGERLAPIFALASDWRGGDLAAYLAGRRLRLGAGWSGRTGLAFSGEPGLTVGRIRREAALAARATASLEALGAGLSALDRLARVRGDLGADPDFAWALEAAPAPPPAPPGGDAARLAIRLVASFAATFLWPLAPLLAAALAFHLLRPHGGPGATLLWTLGLLGATALLLLAAAAVLYLRLRALERSDAVDDRAPDRPVLHEILARENRGAQNHMVSITERKGGLTRLITTRLVFWLIAALARFSFRPGFLGEISTIHFARWATLPGGRDLVFFSNYGGSWESYLEDFVTRAHAGLTAVWSNTAGFPRTANLVQGGASDAERFKHYARRSMAPTPFWYSAYPNLATANIRAGCAIRQGLAAARTANEAEDWLALFGSAIRPLARLESDQIQSLVFGGLGFLAHGEVLLIDLAASPGQARAWLAAIAPLIAWDDGRRLGREAVLTLALGPRGLIRLGLPGPALETFPAAFVDGMTGPGRARILGDAATDPDQAWWWGAEAADAAILVYGLSEAAVRRLGEQVRGVTGAHGGRLARAVPLAPVEAEPHEPFGFLDGVSQPVIRGAYKGLQGADPIHLVEPGEFILGYPDGRGALPPGPLLAAADDPQNRLPVRAEAPDAARDVGRNGSFLVIRQLEQDPDAFWRYCRDEASRLHARLPAPYDITAPFIAAKLVGRWPDGSSLVRNPYQPSGAPGLTRGRMTARPESRPLAAAAIPPPPIDPAAASRGTNAFVDNDFLFGVEDPRGLRCPYGAHIRRANPRDSLDPGARDQVDISNRHRILRVGRRYAPAEGEKPGLMFMCLNGDIERQFEFVQQTWLGSETFHGLSGERDALAGTAGGCPGGFTVPTDDGPVRLAPMARFVTPRGGGYFFLPGRALVAFLAA